MNKIGFSKGVAFERKLNLLPKIILGVRSVFKYAGGTSLGFSAAVSSRFRKLTENNSGV